ncbi:hypothetical protein [Borreliella afzelii]|uniref:hypothetical protein n=1 Tax=Borreliella afzelii TaxID=29518 RepID=UPI00359C1413
MNKKMFTIYTFFVPISFYKNFLHFCYLHNSEQDSSKEKINKRLDDYNFENEKDRSPFLLMLHKLEVV